MNRSPERVEGPQLGITRPINIKDKYVRRQETDYYLVLA